MVLLWCLNLSSTQAIITMKWTTKILKSRSLLPFCQISLLTPSLWWTMPRTTAAGRSLFLQRAGQKWRWWTGYLPRGLLIQRNVRSVIYGKLLKNINHNAPSMSLMKLLLRLVSLSVQEKMMYIKYWMFYTGHEVVRLPVAHCELNPIEMAWAQVKECVRRNNQKFHWQKWKGWYMKGLVV